MTIPNYDRLTWNAVVSLHGAVATLLQGQAATLNLLESRMASMAEYHAVVLGKLDEMTAAAAAEREQVLAAIKALQDQVLEVVPDEYVTEVTAKFDAGIGNVQAIYTPPTPT